MRAACFWTTLMILMLAACDAGVETDLAGLTAPPVPNEDAPIPTGGCIVPTDLFADGGVGKDGIRPSESGRECCIE